MDFLHAHLTGSIPRRALHDVWLRKRAAGEALALEDPLVAMPEDKAYDIETFFPLFSSYIYALLTDEASVRETAAAVLAAFAADGVAYLELRTTPRASAALSAEGYVAALLAEIEAFEGAGPAAGTETPQSQAQAAVRVQQPRMRMRTRLILSVDRRHTLDAARGVLALANRFNAPGSPHRGRIVGLDLCGDPHARTGGAVALFTPVFAAARAAGLGVTVHFAECAAAASRRELETLLAWGPRRLGHVIHEDEAARAEIVRRGLCLELCLSCNVQAGMVGGGFEGHHFGAWRGRGGVSISLGTDDVGVFGSALSNEYRLVAKHFGLDREAICALARDAIEHIFGDEADKQWLREIMWT
ncbi:Adenosine deaminase-like protein [Escovopsis weberi]|uniref:Adenosine deaminase-like protein n=1 Tax=Escovopsis weberi TaxID=150374 RepID=A0A0M8MY29_ESCWE|nr:Adenosine deaminase-like protein [Escovopsis weberi]